MGSAELLEVQRLDDRLEALRAETGALEARLRDAPELAAARSREAAARSLHRAAEAAVRAVERDAVALRDRAKLLDRQLYGGKVRNPQELLTLQRELEEVRARLAVEEDSELELMQTAEDAGTSLERAVAARGTVESEIARVSEQEEQRLAALREAVAGTQAERDLAASRRSPSEMVLYGRVAAHHRPAVTRLLGDQCGGCRLPLGMREVRAIKDREGIVQCSNCDRIIAP